jgi:hypothetical protein
MRSRCLQRLGVGPLVLLVASSVAALIAGTTYAAFSTTTTNSNNSFAAASTFPACNTITPVWMTGFEHGFVSASGGGQFDTLATAGGTPTADQTAVRSGSYSLRIATTGGGASNAQRTLSGSTVVARFGINLASLPSAGVNLAFVDAGTDLILGYDNATQKLQLSIGGASQLSSNAVQAGTWYLVEFRFVINALSSVADWRINGTAQTQVSATTVLSSVTAIGFGSTVSGNVFTANYDDILVSSTGSHYPFGDGKILRLGPDATTYPVTNFQDHDGTALDENSWQNIDDLPMTSTSDYIKQTASAGTSYVQASFSDTQRCIKAVSATLAFSQTTAGTNNGKTSILDGATERIVYSGNMDATALTYKSAVIASASSPWTQSAINGIVARIGYSTDVIPEPQWHAVGLEFETYQGP